MPYDSTLPTNRDHLRNLLGDINNSLLLLPDETYDAKIAAVGYVQAALELALGLIARFGQKPTDAKDGDGSTAYRDRIAAWQQVADDARAGIIREPGAPLRVGVAVAPMCAGVEDYHCR